MTYSEARQNLAVFLNQALSDGMAIIKRADGTSFKVVPEIQKKASPFADVKPLKLNTSITRNELLEIMDDSRTSGESRFGSFSSILKEKPSSFFGCLKKGSGKL